MQIALPNEKRILYGIILVLMVLVWAIPDNLLFDSTRTLCIHKKVLGFECPMCGMTRASHELLHFHLHQALRYNYVVFFWAALLITDIIVFQHPTTWSVTLRKITLIITLVATLLLYLYRIATHLELGIFTKGQL